MTERSKRVNKIPGPTLPETENHKKSVHIITFGCQMNQHDSGVVSGLLEKAGYGMAPSPETADVILFNTCCVRDHAEQRLYSRISQLKGLKKKKPNLLLGIGGCVAQKEKAALTERFPHVDIVFGTNAINDIVPLLKKAEQGQRPVIAVPEDGPAPRSHAAVSRDRPSIHAWVSIMRGCDNHCSYCIVPLVRGPQRSKSPEEVVEEVTALAEQGIVEVTLLGQNVNSYGCDLETHVTFAHLLDMLNEIPGLARIRFTTSHPKDISEELMHAMGRLPKVCEHLHLPVQSGSSRILKRMNRRYSSEGYLEKVAHLREIVPTVSLTTDVIVGFPGETDEDFEQTRSLLGQVEFDGAYIFKFSPRSGTPGSRLDDKLDQKLIVQRHRTLLEFQKQISLQRLKKLVGTTQSILPDRIDVKRPGNVLGRTRGHRVATLPGTDELLGNEIDTQISHLSGWTLIGEEANKIVDNQDAKTKQ